MSTLNKRGRVLLPRELSSSLFLLRVLCSPRTRQIYFGDKEEQKQQFGLK